MAKKKESKQKKMNVRVDFTPMVDMMMLLITFFMLCTSLAKPQAMHLTMPAKDQNLQEQDKDKSKTELTVTLYLAPEGKLYSYIIDKKEKFGEIDYLEETTYGKEGIRQALSSYNPYRSNVAPVQAIINAKADLDGWYAKQPSGKDDPTIKIAAGATTGADTILSINEAYDKALIAIKKGHVDVVKNGQKDMDMTKFVEVFKQMRDGTEKAEELAPTLSVNIKPLDNATYDDVVKVLDEMQICCIGKYVIAQLTEQDYNLLGNAKTKYPALNSVPELLNYPKEAAE
ncbi:MAG: biopolymer transporter ExbD [Prevotella sp.]|nr:biopolymer transporter ExbD [Prevotella sp.]